MINEPTIYVVQLWKGICKKHQKPTNNNVVEIIYVSIDDNKHYMMSSFTRVICCLQPY